MLNTMYLGCNFSIEPMNIGDGDYNFVIDLRFLARETELSRAAYQIVTKLKIGGEKNSRQLNAALDRVIEKKTLLFNAMLDGLVERLQSDRDYIIDNAIAVIRAQKIGELEDGKESGKVD